MSSKLSYAIASVITVLFLYSCAYQEDVFIPESLSSGTVTIEATLDAPEPETRTALNKDNSVVWSKRDAFALLTEKTNDRFDIVSGDGSHTASFSGNTTGSGPFYALYPYSVDCRIENGAVRFKLPQEQAFLNGTFAAGASPALAVLETSTDAANFKNLCGVLQLNLSGIGSQKVKSLEIVNLDGKPLWGDCNLALDGKEGTDSQTLTVSGGSNVIKVVFDKEKAMNTTPIVVNVVVPAGSFAKGAGVRVLDATGAVISLLTSQNNKLKISRSVITTMNKVRIPSNGEVHEVNRRGYYKDVFMDGGCYLTSRTSLPACPYLGWTLDFLATSDSLLQEKVMVKSNNDKNGVILYPDGEPRYHMIYVNGGKANSHGKSLTATGRSRIITFVNNGGSYVGSCAGAFIAHNETTTYKYLSLIPASMTSSGLSESNTGMDIPKNSPLLKYGYDFGGDYYVADVRHNGGGYMKPANLPAKGEILATFVMPGWKMDGNGSIWSYKANDTKGRVVVTGSHPEEVESGEKRDLMTAMMLYSTEGSGIVTPKATLSKGNVRTYDCETVTTAGIGDKQYHHFIAEIPEGAKNIKVTLETDSNINLHLAIRKGDFAWRSDADMFLTQAGNVKSLEFDTLEAGIWYISVYCAAEIKTTCASGIFTQTGDIAALNGVPYKVGINWD